jgi:hypothetical protein
MGGLHDFSRCSPAVNSDNDLRIVLTNLSAFCMAKWGEEDHRSSLASLRVMDRA